MDLALLVARLLLAAVFVVSGLAKLADRAGSRRAVTDFGLPARLANPIGTFLPLAELAVAVALLPLATAWWGGLGALLLLLAFSAGIAVNLARGRTPNCHCFGQLHSEPIGWPTLARNAVLAAIAGFVVGTGFDDAGYSTVGWLDDLSTGETAAIVAGVVALGLLAAEGWLLVHLLGQNGRLLVRLDVLETALAERGVAPSPVDAAPTGSPAGLPVGVPAPAFTLSGLHGETLTLDALRAAGKPVLLIFTDPGCGPCNALLPDIGRWQRDHAAAFTLALLSRGTAEANRTKTAEHGITTVLLQKDREVAAAYQANGTPAAVLVRSDGTIGTPLALGADAIRSFVARTTGAPAPAPAPAPTAANGGNAGGRVAARAGARVGEPAPEVSLPDLTGKTVSLADFKGDQTLVLFWNPGCGFCRRMVDDVKAWEAKPPKGAPKLLVVSTGSVEDNQAMGFQSPVVLDQGFTTGSAFGANGTPSAVLVDAQCKIASDVAVGAPSVLALANGKDPATATGNGGAPAATPKKGDPAPALALPDLNGKTLDLASLRGTKTLILFWNPGCGFCKRMLDDLKAWETKPPKGAPKLLVVSTGDAEANRAMGLRSPVVLDDGFSAGRAFGASGTPSALLIDARGNIASDLAVGAPAVLALAGVKDQAKPTVV